MSAVPYDAGAYETKPIRQWIAHHRAATYTAIATATILTEIVNEIAPKNTLISIAMAVPTLAFVWFVLFVIPHHDRHTCPPCARMIPHDPHRTVSRYLPLFRYLHRSREHGALWFVVRFVVPVLALTALRVTLLLTHAGIVWEIASYMLLMLWGIGVLDVMYRHNLLRPWCPECRDDDGWSDDAHTIPDPTSPGETGTR